MLTRCLSQGLEEGSWSRIPAPFSAQSRIPNWEVKSLIPSRNRVCVFPNPALLILDPESTLLKFVKTQSSDHINNVLIAVQWWSENHCCVSSLRTISLLNLQLLTLCSTMRVAWQRLFIFPFKTVQNHSEQLKTNRISSRRNLPNTRSFIKAKLN